MIRNHLCFLCLAIVAATFAASAPAQEPSVEVPWSRALDQDPAWYSGAEAIRIAENVLLYQHDNGAWAKNIDMAEALGDAERARILAEKTEDGTTLDNGATFTQIRYLARVHEAAPQDRFRAATLRGIDYLLEAQYDNGGWPQFYPLVPGYYEHVTFNDGAMIGVMTLLRDVAEGRSPFTFVDAARRDRAAQAVARGLDVILRTQVVVDGVPTAWCAQYDRVELTCAQARSYELPSLSGGESVGIVRYLMGLEDPAPEVVRAVEHAVRWFEEARLTGIATIDRPDPTLPGGFDRVVVEDPDAPPIWGRFYEIGTNRPIFVGRDGVIRYSLAEIEHERRIGYRYLGYWPAELLEREYPEWRRSLTQGDEGR